MTPYEIYTLCICLIVFVLLVSLSVTLLSIIVKQTIKLIRLGAQDEEIKIEYEKSKNRKIIMSILEKALSYLFTGIFILIFTVSIYFRINENAYYDNFPNVKIVKTSSMAKKNPENKYLFENNLNNQISAFDLVFTYKLPEESQLKVYDIVVYEVDDMLLIHRIVNIEEPNEKHPNERWFLCQGDAIENPDRFPVKYEQMKGIYRGESIPFIGSFVSFVQSPAGWLCIFLVVSAIIATPLIEKKIKQETYARLRLLGVISDAVVTVIDDIKDMPDKEEVQTKLVFPDKKDFRTFKQKLEQSNDDVKNRYDTVMQTVKRIADVKVIEGKKQYTYKRGNLPVVRFNFRGKTLNTYLGLNPNEYVDTKYIYTDASNVKAYSNYPMRVKLSSDRQARWVNELITELCAKNGITLLDKPQEIQTEEKVANIFEYIKGKKDNRTFKERLDVSAEQVKGRYQVITELLGRINGVRVIEAKKSETFKKGNTPIAKLTIKGKTLNAYLGLNPSEYVDTKYIYTDASNVKAHSNYPMRVKLSSDRQARWVNELITELCAKNGITLLDKPQEIQTEEKVANIFEHIKGKKDNRTFKERLDVSAEQVKGRYQVITELLGRINGVRVIEAKKSETFKKGNTPIAKLTIKGKTLNAYLGLNPSEYVDTKYIYTDASNVKAHSNYPMRVKLSSDRQARWVNELITDIITNNSLTIQEKPVTIEKKEFTFADLKKKKAKGFKYRLRLSPLAKERFDFIKAELSKIEGVRCIESKSGITYKFKSKPVVKFAVRGKTLNAYLGLNPKDYQDTKYIYTDVSSLSKYKNYAMRVKVSSNRQVKWTLELINAIIRGV